MTVEIREIVIRGTIHEEGALPAASQGWGGGGGGGGGGGTGPAAPADLSSPELLALIRRQVELALRSRAER